VPPALRFHPAALAEAEAAIDWYRERGKTAAENFISDLSDSLGKIREHPW
jgi:plasmid stabilization system protein ParE